MAKYNILFDKTLNFAARIVMLYKYLVKTQKEFDLPRYYKNISFNHQEV